MKIFKSLLYIIFTIVVMHVTGCGGSGDDSSSNTSTNTAPVANAGDDVNALNNALVILDGSNSDDAEGDTLSYSWSFVSKPASSAAIISSPTNINPTFTTDAPGEYVISLVVNDGSSNSTPDTVSITALSSISHIRDTGQTRCYDNTDIITCPSYGESFHGQDAHFSTNPLRFTDNGSTVSDSITNLMWQKIDDGIKYNWFQAMGIFDATYNPSTNDVCGSLSLDGFNDWRVPARRELLSILNYTYYDVIGRVADATYFNSTDTDYWTSTTRQAVAVGAWAMSNGFLNSGDGTGGLLVRCVRGSVWGQNNYIDNGDGSITDNMSGLMWQQSDDGVARNWQSALDYCENLSLAGSSNWRLPDIKELESLVTIDASNETLQMPSVDTAFFPTTQTDDYWSSTTQEHHGDFSSESAWTVQFSFAGIQSDTKATFRFVRCVHGAPDQPVSTAAVNLIGVWNYSFTSTDIECSGLVATGTIEYQSLAGDVTKIGDIVLQGQGLSLDGLGNCTLSAVNIVNTDFTGRPAEQTVSEYLAYKTQDLLGTGQTVRYDTFTTTQIIEITTLPDGTEITLSQTR